MMAAHLWPTLYNYTHYYSKYMPTHTTMLSPFLQPLKSANSDLKIA